MLGYPHRIKKHRPFLCSVDPRHPLDIRGGHAGYLFRNFRGASLHHLFEFVEVLGPPPDEIDIDESFADDHVHDTVEEGYVSAASLSQMGMGKPGDLRFPGIGYDKRSPSIDRLEH